MNYQELLQDVTHDRKSGAWLVARKAIACLDALIKEKSSADITELIHEVEHVSSEILKSQPGMAQLTNLFNAIFETIENESSKNGVVLARKISGEAKRFEELAKKAVAKVAEFGAELIAEDSEVLVHSNSSTVFEILKKAHEAGKTFQVILTESRPIGEGHACAEELAKLGVHSIFLIDAAVSKGVDSADIVLLGADSVSENTMVNKIGTKGICLLCRESVVPCYAVAESSKFSPQNLNPKKEHPRDPNEVWDSPPAETSVQNYYFDTVPLDLFTGIISEEGILTPSEIGGRIRSQKVSPKLREQLK